MRFVAAPHPDPLPASGEREKCGAFPNSPCRGNLRADLSPRLRAPAYWARRLPATGRRYQHPTWQAIGAWKAGLVVWRDLVQEARSDRCGAVIPARPPAARFALVLSLCSPHTGIGVSSQSPDRDTNRRTRVPEGNPRDREVPWRARPGSRGGLTASWGG